jgi:nucleoside-diphosphate-sugar epimerase
VRVFLAGASGAIGRPLTAQLLAGGHEVVGMTRSEQAATALRAAGAEAVVADALDAGAVREAVVAARPDVMVNQLTVLPKRQDAKAMRGALPATNRVRREGTANLAAAARAAGADRLLSQSVAFYYAPGPTPADEDAPLWTDAPGFMAQVAAALGELERTTLDAGGVVLRYGFLYGPGTWYGADGSAADDVRRRRMPIIGRGDARWPWLHVDDAAAATVAALERWTPGVLNVCEDDSPQMREWLPAFAAAVGAPAPWRVPKLVAGLVAGRDTVHWLTSLRGASNTRAREALGFRPRGWREGFAALGDQAASS